MGKTGYGKGKVCRVCRRALAVFERPDGSHTWVHGLNIPDDHLPDPAEPTEVEPLYRCDFCSTETRQGYILPVRDFQLPMVAMSPDQAGFRTMAGEDWGCCPECAHCIDTNQWNRLYKRNLAALERDYGKASKLMKDTLREIHRLVRKNVRGSLRPIEPLAPGYEPSQTTVQATEWGQAQTRPLGGL